MNLINLIKVYAINSLGINKIFNKGDQPKTSKSVLITVGMIVGSLFILNASFGYSLLIASAVNDKSLILGVMTAATALIVFFTVIYIVKGVIVGFADYEMLMALPIDTKIIITSRLLILYFYSLILTIFILVPANIIYCVKVGPSFGFYIMSFIGLFLIPIIPMIVGCFLGLILQMFLIKIKNGNLWGIIINLISISLIAIGVININGLDYMIKNDVEGIIRLCTNAYPIGSMYTNAISNGNISTFLLFVIISITSLSLFVYVVGFKFKEINTTLLTSKTNGKYKITKLETSSVFVSLFKKEIQRYVSCSIYVFNTTFGVLAMLIGTVAIMFMGEDKIISLISSVDTYNFIKSFIPLVFASLIALSCTTGVSISIEGKNFWILKTIPVKSITIFNAKIAVNLLVTMPISIISSILLGIGLNLDFKVILLTIITSIVCCFFVSVMGIVINLLLPKLNWKTETVVVKQSMSSMMAIFCGQIPTLICGILIVLIKGYSPEFIISIVIVIVVIITVMLYGFLKGKGDEIFNRLA